jgi:hypothetical protein
MYFFNTKLIDLYSTTKSSNGHSVFNSIKATKPDSDSGRQYTLTLTKPLSIDISMCHNINADYFNSALENVNWFYNHIRWIGGILSRLPGGTPIVNTSRSLLSHIPYVKDYVGNGNAVFLMKGSTCIGFMVVQKGECEMNPEWWSLSLICSAVSGCGTVLLGLYLFIIYMNGLNDGNGILDLANGLPNISGFCAYDKFGFEVATSYNYFINCYQPAHGWLVNLPMVCTLSKHYTQALDIIDVVTGDKRLNKNRLCNKETIATLIDGAQNKQDKELITTAYLICEHLLILINMMEQIPQKDIRKLKEITNSFEKPLISKQSKTNKTIRTNANDYVKFKCIKIAIKEFGYDDMTNMFDQLNNTRYPTLNSLKDRIETVKENPGMLKQMLINARTMRTMANMSGGKGNRQTLRRTVRKTRKTRRLQIKKKATSRKLY